MKKKAIKFAKPSKEMREALEAEGLTVEWDAKIQNKDSLVFEGVFCTGPDWEKLVSIDLREHEVSTQSDVDYAIAEELAAAYEDFDIDEEVNIMLQGTQDERQRRGVPNAARLLQDIQEEEACLKRFYEVADAVANKRPIPPNEEDGKELRLNREQVVVLNRVLGSALSVLKGFGYGLMDGNTEETVREIMDKLKEEK